MLFILPQINQEEFWVPNATLPIVIIHLARHLLAVSYEIVSYYWCAAFVKISIRAKSWKGGGGDWERCGAIL